MSIEELEYYGQWKQDEYLDLEVFNRKENGVFVEIGCADPVRFNNTYFLEKNRGWSGVSIDARPDIVEKFSQARRAVAVNAVIDHQKGLEVFLDFGVLSGLLKYLSSFEWNQIKKYQVAGKKINAYWVETSTLEDIIARYSLESYDLLCIDVEGAELSILRTIDFQRMPFSVLLVECNTEKAEEQIEQYLMVLGYNKVKKIGADVVFRRTDLD